MPRKCQKLWYDYFRSSFVIRFCVPDWSNSFSFLFIVSIRAWISSRTSVPHIVHGADYIKHAL